MADDRPPEEQDQEEAPRWTPPPPPGKAAPTAAGAAPQPKGAWAPPAAPGQKPAPAAPTPAPSATEPPGWTPAGAREPSPFPPSPGAPPTWAPPGAGGGEPPPPTPTAPPPAWAPPAAGGPAPTASHGGPGPSSPPSPGGWSPPPPPGKAAPTAAGPTTTQPPGAWAPPPSPGQAPAAPAAPAPGPAPAAPAAPGGWSPPPPPGQAPPTAGGSPPTQPPGAWSPPGPPGQAPATTGVPAEAHPGGAWSPPPPPGAAAAPTSTQSPGGWSPPAPPGQAPASAVSSGVGAVVSPPVPAPMEVAVAAPVARHPRPAVPVAISPSATTERTELFVCTGCGIGEAVDAEALAGSAQSELGNPGRVHGPLCIPEGVEALRQGIADADAHRVVIAACSERVNYDVFSSESLGVDLVGRVNIRELVAWSKPPGEEETQRLAEDYVRMGVTKTRWTRKPKREERDVITALLVVGAGVTGLTTALEAAGAGSEVHLVEKEAALGGQTARFARLFPTKPPYRELEPVTIDALVEAVTSHPNITVYTGASVKSIEGEPGGLYVDVEVDGRTVELRAGAVVMATGWTPDEGVKERVGAADLPDVVTNLAFEDMVRSGRLTRPSDGRVPKRVAIVTRPTSASSANGSGEGGIGDFSFGTNVLDMASLKHALYVTEAIPDARVYLVYEDMVTPGQYESFYRRVSEQPGVSFTKGHVSGITSEDDGRLMVRLERSLLGDDVGLPVDLVVLAAGMVPTTADSTVLNLLYRQGPGLPTAKFGFSDSNFICFPYETRRTGIYAAGTVREPMDVVFAAEDAAGAALKAIQSLELIGSGRATHPRAGDLSLPATRYGGCTQCGRCTEECPFSAIELDEKGFPAVNPERCRRCGICMGACPVRVISFEDYSVEQLSAMMKAIDFGPDPSLPRIVALACENDAYPAFDMAGINRMVSDASVRVVPLRCLGSLNVAVVADALSSGIDGMLLMGCRSGDDYQCHFIQGSALAQRRLDNVKETLNRLTIEPERVIPLEIEISEYDRIPALVGDFVDTIRKMGANPYKF